MRIFVVFLQSFFHSAYGGLVDPVAGPPGLFFNYIAGQDSAPVETDTSGSARLKAGQGAVRAAPCTP